MGFLDYDGFSTFVDGLAEELKKVYAKISHTHTKADITDFPETMPPSAHSHSKSDITDFPAIPSKVSELTNDSGFITGYTETDPTVPAWAKAASKPSYTASEVGAAAASHKHTKSDITDFPATMPPSAHTHSKSDITDFPAIPSKVSELTNDSGFITGYTETDPTVPAWAKAKSKPSYTASEVGAAAASHKHTKSDITDFPAIPSKVSELTNDSGFITGYTETDPTVPAWAKAASKPSYTASEVGAAAASHKHTKADINDFPAIPSKVSELTNDSGYINGISKSDVVNALGYTPADSANGGTQIIKSTGTFNGLGWSNNGDGFYSQTVSVAGVTATNDVIVSPSLDYLEDYTKMGCFAASQANGSLTFKCIDPEDVDVVVEVLILNI